MEPKVARVAEDGARCPFLEAFDAGKTYACTSRTDDQIAISPQYVEVYCLTNQHTTCSLFIRADADPQTRAPHDPQEQSPTTAAPEIATAGSVEAREPASRSAKRQTSAGPRISRVAPFAIGLFALVVLLAGILVFLNRPHNVSRRVAGATHTHAGVSQSGRPAGITWHFPVASVAHPSQVLITLSNSNAHAVTVEILAQSRVVQRVRVPAGSSSEIGLSPGNATKPISIRANGSVAAQRLIVQGGKVLSTHALLGPASRS